MRKALRDFRRVRALGDCGLIFGGWLKNAWRVARAERTAPLVLSERPRNVPHGAGNNVPA